MFMNLQDLKKQLPVKWRVQSFSTTSATATVLAYIDARTVMDVLDEVCGPENWQSDFREIDGNLFAGIGIFVNDRWIWKWDVGSESNMEKEKGLSSDAFKRAAVKWGVGRFLYSLPVKRMKTSRPKNGNGAKPYIVDDNGSRIWDLTDYLNRSMKPKRPNVKPKELPTLSSSDTEKWNQAVEYAKNNGITALLKIRSVSQKDIEKLKAAV